MTTTKINPSVFSALRASCIALLLLTSTIVLAQSNSGRDFWMAQVANLSDKNEDIAIVVSNASANPANITITNPTRSTVTAVIPAGGLQTFIVTSDNPNIQVTGTYTSNVWHIVSDQLIVVYNFQPYVNVISNDAAVLLPTNALGKKYFVGSYVNSTGIPRNSLFSVTATLNATNVNVYNNTGAFVESKVLNQGECYQRLNGSTVAADMTGWYIESDKPVAMYSGNQCSNVGSGASCDLLVDQVLPLETLASTYIGSPSNTRPIAGTAKTPDLFRFVATTNNTIITFTPASVSAPVTLQKGQFVNITTGTPFVANASFPIYGYQFFLSQNSLVSGFVRPLTGDPSMMALPVVDQFLYNYNFVCAPTFPNNFVNVVAPNGIKLYIDNVLVTPTWTTAGSVNGVTYRSANIQVSSGRHTIAGDRKYGIVVYGFGDFASYGYLGGSGLEAINAGCITGGPYQVERCSAPNQPVSVQLNGRPSCEDGSNPTIVWSSPDGVVFSNPNIRNPIATAPGFGTYTVTMSVICGGNTIICSSDLEIREAFGGCANIPAPTLVPPPTVIVPSNPGQPYADNVTLGIATYTAEGSATLTNNALSQFPIGTTTVTWTVTDGYGRTASGNQTVIVVPPPTIVAPPAITVGNDAGQTYATIPSIGIATYQSDYGPNVLTNDAPLNNQYPLGTTTVTWTITDGFNRTASATQLITVSTPPPTIVAPPAINVVAGYNGVATVASLGTPTTTVSVNPETVTNAGTLAQYPIGTTNVTWTVTDGLGRTASDVQQVIVTVPAPQIAPPANITVSNDPGQTFSTNVTLVNPVYQAVGPVTLTNDAPAQFPLGTTTVNWTLTDAYGNTVTTSNTVTVVSAPPTIVAPPTINVVAGYNGLATVASLGTPTTTVSVNPATVTNAGTLAQYPIGTTNVTWTVTDGLGRTASDVQQVIVTVPAPQIAPPANITVSNDPGQTYSTNVTLVNPVYQAVGPVTLTNDAPAQFPLGTTTVNWTLTDAYGNTVTTSNTVTVVSAPPTIIAPPTVTVTAGYNGLATLGSLGTPTTTVSVNPATVTNAGTLAQYPIGTTNVTWTVTDGIGRTARDVQQVIVLAPLPQLNPVPDITVSNNPGVNYATVTLVPPTYQAIGPVTLTSNAPAQFPIGTTTVTWTLTDKYGKTTTTTQKVTVVSAPPTLVPPANITVTAAAGQTSATISNIGTATYTVSVNPATLTNTGIANRVYPVGTTTVTWTVTDGLGRTASGTQTITVNPSSACTFVTSITSIPTNNTPTGGNPKNLYIGYGAQTTKLQVTVPNTGGPYTFQWTGTGLSSYTSAAPIFTPGTTAGNYSFTVTVKNASGCTSSATISICVRDVRSLDKNGNWDGKKVIVCHLPPGNIPNVQYIDVSINAVPTHVPNHGGDGLGNTCVQPSCTSPYARGIAPATETFGVKVYPNPATSAFSLTVKTDDKYTDINIRIIDAFGRTVEVMKSVNAGRTVLFGDKYANGAYYAEVIQGTDKKIIPLVKAN